MSSAYSPNANIPDGIGVRGRARPGERPKALSYHTDPIGNCVDASPNTSQVSTVTIDTTNNGDAVKLIVDGAEVSFVAAATVGNTALAGETALETASGEGTLLEPIIGDVTVNTATITITFADFKAHNVTFSGQAGTTATVDTDVTASERTRHKAGTFVARHPTQGDPTITRVRLPTAGDDDILGAVYASAYPNHQTPPNDYGLAADESYPEKTPFSVENKGPFCVRIAGDVAAGDPVYVKRSGSNRGYAVNGSTGTGTSQITRGDVVFNGTDLVGLNVDNEVEITVASVTSDDATATALMNAWNGNEEASALAQAFIDLSGAESYIFLKFKDTEAHVVTAVSPATADIIGITNTTSASAAAAVKFKGRFTETRTAAQGDAYVDFDLPA